MIEKSRRMLVIENKVVEKASYGVATIGRLLNYRSLLQ